MHVCEMYFRNSLMLRCNEHVTTRLNLFVVPRRNHEANVFRNEIAIAYFTFSKRLRHQFEKFN